MAPIVIEGRYVYVVTGRLTQTVRVCTADNQRTSYEWVFRLGPGQHVTGNQVAERASLSELVRWLEGLGAREESSGPTTQSPPCPPTLRIEPDTAWFAEAVQAVEEAIDALIGEFTDHPYLHRVEHSLHARLFELLAARPIFNARLPIGTSGYFTQPVHKEWPETQSRNRETGRRGNFDLAILSPNQLADPSLSVDDFRAGRVAAAIVIEMGLDYGYQHLRQDHDKLLNSCTPAGYLVDFRRTGRLDDQTASLILNPDPPVKTAFVHYPQHGPRYVKPVAGRAFQSQVPDRRHWPAAGTVGGTSATTIEVDPVVRDHPAVMAREHGATTDAHVAETDGALERQAFIRRAQEHLARLRRHNPDAWGR